MVTDQVSDNWYESFFQGINCELWEKAIPGEVTQEEVEFLVSELDLAKGQHILDIPCGFGRHALALARKGFKVTGVDISETFITSLTKKMADEDLDLTAIQADILSLQLDGKFSGAVCMGNSFGYFNIERMDLFVHKVSSSLASGGKFIINSGMIAESILPNFLHYAENKVYHVDNITMEVTNEYQANESYMVSKLHFTKEGHSERHSFKHYVFTLGEVNRLLKSNGLNILATYRTTSKDTYKLGDRQIYIVAQKV